MEQNHYPLGFCFALAQNSSAMKTFINLPELKQREILKQSHTVSSKAEMQALVDHLAAREGYGSHACNLE